MFFDPLTLPLYGALRTVHYDQLTLKGGQHHLVTITGETRQSIIGIELSRLITAFDMRQFLSPWVIAVEAILIDFHPETLFAVNVEALHTIGNTEFREHTAHITLKGLRHRVVDAVVHSLFQPKFAIVGLHDFVGEVVAHGNGITLVGKKSLNAVSVVAIQSVGRTEPHEAPRITVNAVDLRVRQSVTGIQTTKLDVRNGSLETNRPHKHKQ